MLIISPPYRTHPLPVEHPMEQRKRERNITNRGTGASVPATQQPPSGKKTSGSGIDLDDTDHSRQRITTAGGGELPDASQQKKRDSGIELESDSPTYARKYSSPIIKRVAETPDRGPKALGPASSNTKTAVQMTQKITSFLTVVFVGVMMYTYYAFGTIVNKPVPRSYNGIALLVYGLMMAIHHPIAYRYYILNAMEYRRIHLLMTVVGLAVAGTGIYFLRVPV